METPRGNLVAGMKWFLGTYTARFNRRHGLTGHLFAGRYKAIVVDGRGSGYLRTVCTYVHLNPARAGLLRPAQPLQAYRWSSYPWYVGPTSKRPTWLNVDRVLGEEGLQQDTPASRRQFAHRMEVRRAGEDLDAYTTIRCGWCVGDQDFRVQLLDQLAPRFRSGHYGPERDETEERRAERIVREELRKRRATEADLRRWPKGAAAKVQIAQALRRATTMPQAWIARRLHAGSPTYLYNRLYLLRAGRRRVVNNRD